MMEAWLSASETTASSGPSRVSNWPALASKQLGNRMVSSVPRNALRRASRRLWGKLGAADGPHRRHAEAVPVQCVPRGLDQPRMVGEAQVVVGAQVDAGRPVLEGDLALLGRGDDLLVPEQAVGLEGLEPGGEVADEFAGHGSSFLVEPVNADGDAGRVALAVRPRRTRRGARVVDGKAPVAASGAPRGAVTGASSPFRPRPPSTCRCRPRPCRPRGRAPRRFSPRARRAAPERGRVLRGGPVSAAAAGLVADDVAGLQVHGGLRAEFPGLAVGVQDVVRLASVLSAEQPPRSPTGPDRRGW